MECIFCKIIKGEVPSFKVYEDEKVFAFMDINPINDGHMLVIPKTHAENLFEIEESDFLAVMSVVRRLSLAIRRVLGPDGMNLMQLNGEAAGQVVPHLHVHIVPRWGGDGKGICEWELVPGDRDKIKGLSKRIQEAL
nr:HIT family protein [Desulfobacterales bacterium]